MTTPAAAPLLKMLLAQTRSELLMRWRVPAFSVTNLVLPIVFFIFFGLPIAHLRRRDGVSLGAYLLASFGAYADNVERSQVKAEKEQAEATYKADKANCKTMRHEERKACMDEAKGRYKAAKEEAKADKHALAAERKEDRAVR